VSIFHMVCISSADWQRNLDSASMKFTADAFSRPSGCQQCDHKDGYDVA
jgi:hypothetical protein